jgi:hypothetical protein
LHITRNTDLLTINTPPKVVEAIIYGTEQWINNQAAAHHTVHAPTVGSLRGPDILLTAAFTEQYQSIGWYHLLMGRLNTTWSAAVAMYRKVPNDPQSSTTWTTQAILCLWKYTRNLWNYRNTVVHGATDQEVADKIRATIAEKVTDFYNQYRNTPHFILRQHHYLFKSRTLQQHLQLDIDSINCWLRSVEEAIQALHHHNTQQRLNSARFFAPFYAAGRTTNTTHSPETSSSDEDYYTQSDTTSTSTTTFTSFTSDTASVTSHSRMSTTTQDSHTSLSSENTSRSTAPPPS